MAGIGNLGKGIYQIGGLVFTGAPRLGIEAINSTGSAIAADKLVAVIGFDTTSGRPKIVLADADVATHDDVYVTLEAIASGARGSIFKGGPSAITLDTNSASAVGDPVYLSTTAGGFSHTAPTGSDDDIQPVGWVTVKSATVGSIYWYVGAPRQFGSNRFQAGAVLAAALGVTAGTVAASKAVVVDANLDIGTFRHVTLNGNLVSGSTTISETELGYLDGLTAGTTAASKALVTNAAGAMDVLRATTSRTIGGTGVAAAAGVVYEFTKEITAIAENTATAILTVSVPNAAHACRIEIDVMGRQGAGGTIGADESVSTSKYIASLARTAGVASVLTLGAQLGASNSPVSGGDTITAVLTQVANAEGVGATNTHTIKVTIDSSNNASGNHKCNVFVRLFNANVTGVTIS